jgi:hypothetical protein
MFTVHFWKSTAERAVKSAAQALVGVWAVDGVFNLWSVEPGQAAGIAAGAAVLSLLTSIVSLPFGDSDTPSLVRE